MLETGILCHAVKPLLLERKSLVKIVYQNIRIGGIHLSLNYFQQDLER